MLPFMGAMLPFMGAMLPFMTFMWVFRYSENTMPLWSIVTSHLTSHKRHAPSEY